MTEKNNNVELKFCKLCNKSVQATYWSKHITSKKHIKKVEETPNVVEEVIENITANKSKDDEIEKLKEQVSLLQINVESLQFQLNTVNSFLLNFREILKNS